MIRAVLDANVFVTAVLTPAGAAAAVLEAWRAERFALLVSPAISDEVARVLSYPKIVRRHGWSRKEILAFVQDLRDLAILTPGRVKLSLIREDPDDDRYLECARSCAGRLGRQSMPEGGIGIPRVPSPAPAEGGAEEIAGLLVRLAEVEPAFLHADRHDFAMLLIGCAICSSVWLVRLAIFNQTGADGESPQFSAGRRLAGECR